MRIYGAATVLTLSLMSAAQLRAQHQLVTPAEIEKVSGLKGIVPAPKALQPDGYQSFVRGSDNVVVLEVALPHEGTHDAFVYTQHGMGAAGPTESVAGVGDEAFSSPERRELWIRKGGQMVVVRGGYDVANQRAILTADQLKAIGKLVAARI